MDDKRKDGLLGETDVSHELEQRVGVLRIQEVEAFEGVKNQS